MAAQVKILVKGYTNANSSTDIKEEKTRSTITLVRDGDFVIVVDPGTIESQQIIIDALAKEGLSIHDVNYVCITHSHIDHYRNIGMFPKAKIIEFYGVWDGEVVVPWSENFSENIKIMVTPGHDSTSISILATTYEGVVAICGDVFWKENYPEDPYEDTYADNYDKLIESRKKILETADWVVPGHGGIYRTEKGHMKVFELEPELAEKNEVKNVTRCRKCKSLFNESEKCLCRPWLCFRCCGCDIDCDFCSCSHKKNQ